MPGRSFNLASSSNIYKFSGKELDEENGLDWYYFGARYYDPASARWLSVDPLAAFAPDMTPYHYVHNNPINRIDRFGLIDDKIWDLTGEDLIEPIEVVAERPTKSAITTTVGIGMLIGEALRKAGIAISSASVGIGIGLSTWAKGCNIKKEAEDGVEEESDPVDDILDDATPGEPTLGKTKNWDKNGGQNQADKDFDHLKPTNVKPRPNGTKTGELPGGKQVNVRPHSTDGRPTLEIQSPNGTKIKIRYNQ